MLSLFSIKPVLHEQLYVPGRLLHTCWQLCSPVLHSSMSEIWQFHAQLVAISQVQCILVNTIFDACFPSKVQMSVNNGIKKLKHCTKKPKNTIRSVSFIIWQKCMIPLQVLPSTFLLYYCKKLSSLKRLLRTTSATRRSKTANHRQRSRAALL